MTVSPADLQAAAAEALAHFRSASRLLAATNNDEGGLSLLEAARRLLVGDATGTPDLGCRMGPFWFAGYDAAGALVWIGWHHLCTPDPKWDDPYEVASSLFGLTIGEEGPCSRCGQAPPPLPVVPERTRAEMLRAMRGRPVRP